MKFISLSFLSLLWMANAIAEYRVYQYYVRPKNPLFPNAKAYLITSSLDPVSYKSYHGGEDSIVVDLLRTWICPGYTGKGLDYCESPYTKLDGDATARLPSTESGQ